jgi:UDP-N-acetylglucosamine acyltransferase
MPIHPTAVVDPRADLHPTVDVGPFCVVGPHVTLGPHTRLISHVVLAGRSRLGAHNVLHPFASVGGVPQDLSYGGEPTELVMGDHNVVRENVTINIGTERGRKVTQIGSHCLLMAYAHVAHDCVIGDRVVLSNSAALAGHVEVDDHAIVGGLAAVHQHCRIGRLAFVGGGSMVAQDVPPFCLAQGDRATLAGLNVVGLRRAGWEHGRIRALRRILGELFDPSRPRELTLNGLEKSHGEGSDDALALCRFVRTAARGVCRLRPQAQSVPLDAAPQEVPHPQKGALRAADAC